jgi:hypothetical protein
MVELTFTDLCLAVGFSDSDAELLFCENRFASSTVFVIIQSETLS